jgi:hypothetical protein
MSQRVIMKGKFNLLKVDIAKASIKMRLSLLL